MLTIAILQPQPKGDAKFFKREYGTPDGTEDLKYAQLGKWPLKANKVRPSECHPPV